MHENITVPPSPGVIVCGVGATHYQKVRDVIIRSYVDWLQSLKQFFINVSYHILVASLTLMALFKTEPSE